MPNRLQRGNSQVREKDQTLVRRARRNSLTDTAKNVNKMSMLPPIFSGPQKVASQKQKLIPLPQKKDFRSQVSEASPLRYKSDTFVANQSERAMQDSSALKSGSATVPHNPHKADEELQKTPESFPQSQSNPFGQGEEEITI
jgi:hypothetical protein